MWGLWQHQPLVRLVSWRKLGVCSGIILFHCILLFWSFILPVLEYCSLVWMSAVVSQLSLLNLVVRNEFRFSGGAARCYLWLRDRVATLSLFYHIDGFAGLLEGAAISSVVHGGRPTYHNLSMHPFTLVCPRCCTSQLILLVISDAIWKKTLLFFSKKTVFYDEKNMTSEKNTEKVFFFVFFIINYVLKKNKGSSLDMGARGSSLPKRG